MPVTEVSGRVLDELGTPVPGTLLTLWSGRSGPDAHPVAMDVADEFGRFNLKGDTSGIWRITTNAPVGESADERRAWISQVIEGVGTGARDLGDLFVAVGEFIRGAVLLANGSPLSRVSVYAEILLDAEAARLDEGGPCVTCLADELGRFELLISRPGSYRITVRSVSGRPLLVVGPSVFRSGTEDVRVVVAVD